MSDASPDEVKLNDLMFLALDHAIESNRESGGPLTPFSITEDVNGKRTLTRYAAERLEEGEARGKKRIEESKADIVRYAFAWDGYVTIGGKKSDAILVEAGDKVAETGILLCQRYETKGLIKKSVVPFGNPALVGRPSSRIK
jgi:hypothetical protein